MATATTEPSASPARVPDERAEAQGVRGRRIHFVDLLRLIASLQMVHGHTLHALMADELREGVVFERWTWARGLVSVAFMVAAGLSFHLSTIAIFDKHRSDAAKVRKRFRRGLWLVVLGYLLHFPAGALSGDPSVVAAAWNEFQIADVLQCIGLCILLLQTIVVLAKRPQQVVWAAAVFGVLAFGLAPLGERLVPDGPLRFLMNYVSHQSGSLFPLAPWGGFVMAGVVVGQLVLPEGTRTPIELPVPRLLAVTAAVALMAAVAHLLPYSLVDETMSRNAQPAFNLTKLAAVLAIITLLAVAGRGIRSLPRVLQILAGESLMLYVFHLMVLYAGGVGLFRLYGHSLSLPVAFGVALVLIAVSATVGLLWFRVKSAVRARGR